ncbi:MAG: asparagine synthase (glutamine-hydrolyzing) [Gammaproteobacteria bacterium]
MRCRHSSSNNSTVDPYVVYAGFTYRRSDYPRVSGASVIMCGIAGIVSFGSKPVQQQEVRSMCAAMQHRGPDQDGFYIGEHVGLGMRRLCIIDLETGQQPLQNEDGTVKVVMNGEIYNYMELRKDLEQRGHRFYSQTDTETLVHLYEEYGTDCVTKLRGMFALALWDERKKMLFLARDRIGIKPLFYAEVGGRFAFGSELKVLLQLPELERGFNWQSVGHLFGGLSTPAGESIVAGVHKLEPGHTLVLSPGKPPTVSRYWDVQFEPDYTHNETYLAEQLRELLEESVKLHLVSDVPLGAFLSGGLDSSAIVACMARQSTSPVRTFSIGFHEQGYNEARYARRVANQFGTEHHELMVDPDIEDLVEDMAWYLDEPFGDSSAIPTYLVSRLASEQVTVVLSGDGGDELFAGYEKYQVEGKERRYEYVPAPLRKILGCIGNGMSEGAKGRNFLRHFALSGAERYLDAITLFKVDQQRCLFNPEVSEIILRNGLWHDEVKTLTRTNLDWLSTLQYLDMKSYLPLDILTKVDRMSMANSIETRVPLLDHKLVEFAAKIPPEFKLRNGVSKSIFKRAMRGILPDEIIDRRKHGFAVPLGAWFRGRLTGFVHDLLLSGTCVQRGLFNPDYIRQLLRIHETGRNMDSHLWTLISFELWCRTFMDGKNYTMNDGRRCISPHTVTAVQA